MQLRTFYKDRTSLKLGNTWNTSNILILWIIPNLYLNRAFRLHQHRKPVSEYHCFRASSPTSWIPPPNCDFLDTSAKCRWSRWESETSWPDCPRASSCHHDSLTSLSDWPSNNCCWDRVSGCRRSSCHLPLCPNCRCVCCLIRKCFLLKFNYKWISNKQQNYLSKAHIWEINTKFYCFNSKFTLPLELNGLIFIKSRPIFTISQGNELC